MVGKLNFIDGFIIGMIFILIIFGVSEYLVNWLNSLTVFQQGGLVGLVSGMALMYCLCKILKNNGGDFE